MNSANPTRLSLGMRGNFGGMEYCVVGRSVLGENENGEMYYWNEFNLEADSGETATLVYDESGRDSQWRIFTMFDPEYAMTAADAESKRVGDRLNLTGEDVRVSFRGVSQVCYTEGKAPEGEQVGTVAQYFNAVSGGVMQVVSWTGDEVEFYTGTSLTPGLVASAFGLSQDLGGGPISRFSSSDDSDSNSYLSGLKFVGVAVLVVFFFFLIFGRGFSFSTGREALPVTKLLAGAPPLTVGASGKMFGQNYRVESHALVEIDEVGAKWERDEYALASDNGSTALLVCGDKPGGDWLVFQPFFPSAGLTATQAAAKQTGDTVSLDDFNGRVTKLFLTTIEQTDGDPLGAAQNGAVSYGFLAVSGPTTLLARWNEAGIQLFRGQSLRTTNGAACFAAQ